MSGCRIREARRAHLVLVFAFLTVGGLVATPVAGAERPAVGEVTVSGDGPERLITFEGLEEVPFAASESGDPKRLVIELAGATLPGGARRVPVGDGLIEAVALVAFDPEFGLGGVRVEIELLADAQYSLAYSGKGLEVQLRSELAKATRPVSESTGEIADAVQPERDPWTRDATPLVAANEATPPALEKRKNAEQVLGIAAEEANGGVLVRVEADGKIGLTRTQTLDNPHRLVVDLPGLKTKLGRRNLTLDSDLVRSVTMSSGSGRIRVELHGVDATSDFADRRLVPVRDGLWIAIGSSPELERVLDSHRAPASSRAQASKAPAPTPDEMSDPVLPAQSVARTQTTSAPTPSQEVAPEPVAPAPTAEAASTASTDDRPDAAAPVATALVEVVGVKVSSQPDRERIVVLGRAPLTYEVRMPNPETVVISLPGSVISSDAVGRIETPSGGPISLVTAFQQPEVSPQEVRVVVKRDPGVEPELSSEGGLLFIDFPKPAAVTAEETHAKTREAAMALARRSFVEEIEPMLDGSQRAEPRSVRDADAALDSEWQRTEIKPFETEATGASLPAGLADTGSAAAAVLLREGGLSEEKTYGGRRISLDFKDVPISDVLRLVAEVSDLNVVAGDEIKGKVTIRMMEVPWDLALDVILMTKGLGFVRVGNVIRIAPNDVLKAEAEVRLQERRNREKLEDLIVKIHPVNYANVSEMAALVEQLLSERGSVNRDERTSTLIIKDIPSVVNEAVALVEAIDTQTPQVLIEAKIVEANLDFSRELGSEWSIGTQQYADPWNQTGYNKSLGGRDFKLHDTNALSFANPINGTATGTAALSAFLLDDKLNLDVTLKAREAMGETKVVSSPRIVTMDNRTAIIEQGVSIPFQTFEQGDAKLEFVDAVLSLTVTPHITSDQSIIMELELTRNAPSEVPNATGSPSISKNVAKTETLVRDGQTLVLGGIYTVEKSDNKKAVPYLSRIPILGGAFQSKSVRDDRKELLMFVTPRIIHDPAAG